MIFVKPNVNTKESELYTQTRVNTCHRKKKKVYFCASWDIILKAKEKK